ncbi:hypothetical protein ACJOMK_04545 [Mycoplasmopsis synoviae]
MLTGHVMFQQSVVVPVVYFLIFYQKMEQLILTK